MATNAPHLVIIIIIISNELD